MWHMNEESGNIGWGIPEAFGEALAQSRPLADDFYRVLFSYIRNREGDNTWCDYAPLRLSCYRAVERVITAWPDLKHEGLCVLHEARNDPDPSWSWPKIYLSVCALRREKRHATFSPDCGMSFPPSPLSSLCGNKACLVPVVGRPRYYSA